MTSADSVSVSVWGVSYSQREGGEELSQPGRICRGGGSYRGDCTVQYWGDLYSIVPRRSIQYSAGQISCCVTIKGTPTGEGTSLGQTDWQKHETLSGQ